MEHLKEKTAGLAEHVEDFAQTFYKLSVLKVTEKATNAVSFAVVVIAFSLLGVFALLFLGIALSWWLGDLVGNRALGFVLGAGGFILLFLIIALLRKNIVFPFIRDLIIKKVYD
ncbi:MAG: hypothetical protein EOO05_11345 [Chitinophagaceae bacterium]|nr:MAG: hypothetical protein EOO05_11345 [Chitinophagaceae bacterium]